MAGGTGGHVFPAIAVAKHLREQGWNVSWLGTADHMEARIVPENGFDIDFIKVSGVRRNGLLGKIKAPFKVLSAVMQARKIMKRLKPDAVLGMGGYASGPGGLAAKLCNIPLIIHEQNAAPGLTNRVLSRIASRVCTGFPGAFPKIKNAAYAGNPVRPEIAAMHDASLPEPDSSRPLRVLVIGGSQGAQALNLGLPAIFKEAGDIEIRHQAGKGKAEHTKAVYDALSLTRAPEISEFINDMAGAYAWADIIVCRAGASTVAEIAAARRMAIFVPLPTAVDDHQTKNARFLESAGGAFVIPQSELGGGKLLELLKRASSDRDFVRKAQQASGDAAKLNATSEVAAICGELADAYRSKRNLG